MNDIENARYWDKQLKAASKLVEILIQDVKVWDQIPDYRKHGRLEYYSLLHVFLGHIGGGAKRGELTKRQLTEFRNLERIAQDALGTIKILKEKEAQGEG